ncbi:helix-turn-helix domain-containing protein [Zunongwangia endophytica]|uniref:Helix-turn-helix domain-containing protein n=1 Tax=Zunongwangia endophytica TaxID=1808945 RepID=A0ABV8HCJ9_9FLAO|nr:AraC family transcriptional regulator [Zunongwangia endophytica]MDN3594348.1 AraC family transcriptional regulator [Zunongwangia endophytica]
MIKLKQFQSLVIHDYAEESFHLPSHSHTYYELIYIFSGRGEHFVNSIKNKYSRGDVFVLSPNDEHYFDIVEYTHFIFIKFTENYFQDGALYKNSGIIKISPVEFMKIKFLKETKIALSDAQKTMMKNIMENIAYYNLKSPSNIMPSSIIYTHILAVFGIIQETMKNEINAIQNQELDKDSLISFIHENIYFPEKIRANHLSGEFNISTNYFSMWFKRNFGMNLSQYANRYKIELIKKRLIANRKSIKEISLEFNFADASHFSKFFKNCTKMSPSQYKKNHPQNNKEGDQ